MRLTRDVAGKFGFRKPAALHKRLAPGLSGPKMNSSGGKAIWLSDDEKTVRKKIMKHAFSGGQVTTEKHRRLGGNPDIDVSFQYLRYLFEDSDEKLAEIEQSYRSGEMLSGELKQYLVDNMNEYLATHRKRRVMVEKNLDKFLME